MFSNYGTSMETLFKGILMLGSLWDYGGEPDGAGDFSGRESACRNSWWMDSVWWCDVFEKIK